VTTGTRQSPAFLAVLIAVSSLNPLAINMFVPSLPCIMRSLGTDFGTVQLTLSLYLFATAIAQLILGPLSDRFGRRPVLLIGLGIFVAASVLCLLALSIGMLLTGRVLQGIGGCAGNVVSRAIIRDRYDRERAATVLAYVTMGYATAPMIGTVIGGFVEEYLGWRANFALLLGLAVIATAAAWRALPETRIASGAAGSNGGFGGFVALGNVPAFWAYTLVATAATACFFIFLGGAPFLASHILGLSASQFGLWFLFVSSAYVAGNFLAARWSLRIGLYRMMLLGAVVMLAGAVAMAGLFFAGVVSVLSLFVPMFVVTFGNGMVLPMSIAGSVSVRPDLAGAASGLAGSLQIGFGGVATVIIGRVLSANETALPVGIWVVGFAVVTLLAVIWARTARG
jgi:DHA1 family bicyclomycin/chloramphenicol resistance-like MFS transporter